MSENASDCTQNAAYRDRKLKKILGRGLCPLPRKLGWVTPSPNPTALGALFATTSRSTILADVQSDVLLPSRMHTTAFSID